MSDAGLDASLLKTLYGTDAPPAQRRRLQAGPLSVEFEAGNLRYIRFGGAEVLRGIAFLVRDTGWGTYQPTITDLFTREQPGLFEIRYQARCSGPEGVFAYQAMIEGRASGTLLFACEGAPVGDLPANRVGFVVLHPIEGMAGRPIEVEHTDGSRKIAMLPDVIAPDQPLLDIRALTHEVAPGTVAHVRMEGDAYEMEDQRNWTDASFKTYVRPLSKPRPFVVRAGEKQVQSVMVTIQGPPPAPATARPGNPVLSLGGPHGTMPAIGLAVAPGDCAEAIEAAALLRSVGPQHLVLRFDAQAEPDMAALAQYAALTALVGGEPTLEIIIRGRDAGPELDQAARLVAAAGLRPAAVVPSPARDQKTRPSSTLPPGESSFAQIYAAARRAFPGCLVGGGMLTSFTELNRNPPPASEIDFVTHGTAAIVHAADDASVLETLEALPSVIRSTRRLMGNLPYRLGPSGLGLRENPYGPAGADNPELGRVPMARSDPRHRGLFGAAWTLAYLAIAAREGLAAVTAADGAGDLGVVERRGGEQVIRPIAHVLRGLARGHGRARLETTAVAGLASIAFEEPAGPELWIANQTADTIVIEVGAPELQRIAWLDQRTPGAWTDLAWLDTTCPLSSDRRIIILPFAVARLVCSDEARSFAGDAYAMSSSSRPRVSFTQRATKMKDRSAIAA